ncbi:MAG: hypothetical protein OEM84_01895 [Acidimicrobiia bacterium]|nr:hypothetical protein [Acidimicrobiia bacterium]
MRLVFAVSLVLGILALIAWVLFWGRRSSGPYHRGSKPQQAIAATVAFGMGGLSAAYAGWSLGLATGAAVAAAALASWYAGTVGAPGGEGRD